MIVKICGLRNPEQALAAVEAGADWLGLVFAPSRRRVSPQEAATISAAVRAHPRSERVLLVGLFVNAEPAEVNAIVAKGELDLVQLSGDEPASYSELITRPILKSLRLDGSPAEAAWLAAAQYSTSAGKLPAVLPLIDAHVPGHYGGTGRLADWEQAALLAQQQPLILAGGLTPTNIAAAIATVRPYGVDVSSGVEREGVKDAALITAFVAAAREAGLRGAL